MGEELLACPFCGRTEDLRVALGITHQVACKCGVVMHSWSKHGVKDKWNRRVTAASEPEPKPISVTELLMRLADELPQSEKDKIAELERKLKAEREIPIDKLFRRMGR
jgi:hypothetical protein